MSSNTPIRYSPYKIDTYKLDEQAKKINELLENIKSAKNDGILAYKISSDRIKDGSITFDKFSDEVNKQLSDVKWWHDHVLLIEKQQYYGITDIEITPIEHFDVKLDEENQTASVKYKKAEYTDVNIVVPYKVTLNGKDYLITKIDNDAFREYALLENIVTPNSVTSIGSAAFYKCKQLENINIPLGLKVISAWSFGSCDSLKNLDIPSNITTIENYAFYGCPSLDYIKLPNSVTDIANTAFTNHSENLIIECYKNSKAAEYAIANSISCKYIDDIYCTKSDITSEISNIKSEILSNITDLHFVIVDKLPEIDIETNAIYLLKNSDDNEHNHCTEYIYTDSGWEIIGSTQVDLSPYYTKTESDLKYADIDSNIQKIWGEINYVEPKIESFTMTPNTENYELGTKIEANALTFNWSLNKAITSISFTDITNLLATDTQATNTNAIDSSKVTVGNTLSKTFKLKVTDEKNATVEASKSIKFLPYVYYGSSIYLSDYNSSFVLGLSNKTFKSSKTGSYAITVADGQYGFIALPKYFVSANALIVNISGFDTELEYITEVSHTNANGYTQPYVLFKTTQPSLGEITMKIS